MEFEVLANASTDTYWQFLCLIGKAWEISSFDLSYNVIMKLVKYMKLRGCHFIFENFYPGVQLPKDGGD